MKTLKDLFLSELADLYDAERQIIKALPKIAKAATCSDLKKLILSHFNETEENLKKIEQVFQSFGEKAKRQTCKATEGLLFEFSEIADNFKGSPAINAAMVSVAQKVDHYEVASLGCLHEWAGLLGNKEAATHLQVILNVEKAANESLTKLARALCNKEAMGSCEEKRIVKNLNLKTKPQTKPALVS